MDISSTISTVRREYREYLKQKYPSWSESTLKNHVSDAFYLWKHTVLPFWKCLIDDTSMQNAKQAIYDYLKNEQMSNQAEEQTDIYFTELEMLKTFLDETFGGVKNRVGYELDCEVTIYNYAKLVYEGTLKTEDAIQKMAEEVPCYNQGSHKVIVMVFASMMHGQKYSYKINTEATLYFIQQIGIDFGETFMENALKATKENIIYYYEQTGNKSNSILRGCRTIAKQHGIDIVFDDSIFEDIIPKQTVVDEVLADNSETHYWIYSPYEQWEELYRNGIITIGRDYLGDPQLYETKAQMQRAMQDLGTERYTTTYRNAVLEIWQFVHEMKSGDIIIVKKGKTTILGRGIVLSEFIYDETKPVGYKYYRKVVWTHKGEWEYSGNAVNKTLMDITKYTEYVNALNEIFHCEDAQKPQLEESLPTYTETDFLNDVYMEEERYVALKRLLLAKKNVILQGAPGVGKTYVAKRLAFSIMGEKDNSRVKMVQFHQSYSYEDFIMGFRPTETGFVLKKGVFYEFCCKAAEDDSDRPYFFIIDEINRGNLSKIFGELFMLLENDKRGVNLQLLYADEQFSIPSNVHIIGMMNTADRSLAMLDYALRRRFAFFEMTPAFQTSGFRAYQTKINQPKFDKLIKVVERLNKEIAEDDTLGEGFCIGHSYFCTNMSINEEWIHSLIEYELIPLLKEYWFDEPRKVKNWSNILREVVE